MNIVVLRERQPGESRVALIPESVRKLVALKATVLVESGAGIEGGEYRRELRAAGAQLSADREALMAQADVLVTVNRPTAEDFSLLRKGGGDWVSATAGRTRAAGTGTGARIDNVRDGADSSHHARPGNGYALFDGDRRWLQGGDRRR